MNEVEEAASLPLVVVVRRPDGTPVTGLAPTAALRRVSDGFYFDFADLTWKAAGWTTRTVTLVAQPLAPGVYQALVALATVPGAEAGFQFATDYTVVDGPRTTTSSESFRVKLAQQTLDILRAVHFHRTEEAPGTPGSLVVYKRDAVTPFLTYELRDFAGSGVVGITGAPSRRTQGTLLP